MTLPTQDDVLAYFTTLSNRGRWGADDRPAGSAVVGFAAVIRTCARRRSPITDPVGTPS